MNHNRDAWLYWSPPEKNLWFKKIPINLWNSIRNSYILCLNVYFPNNCTRGRSHEVTFLCSKSENFCLSERANQERGSVQLFNDATFIVNFLTTLRLFLDYLPFDWRMSWRSLLMSPWPSCISTLLCFHINLFLLTTFNHIITVLRV